MIKESESKKLIQTEDFFDAPDAFVPMKVKEMSRAAKIKHRLQKNKLS